LRVKNNVWLVAAVVAAIGIAALWRARAGAPAAVQQQSRILMDTYCTIRAPGGAAEQAAIGKAFARMREIDRRFNALNTNSPVAQFNAHGTPIADPDIVEVIREALEVSARTDGAFDITVQPLVELWGFYGKHPAVPAPERIEACRRTVGWRNLAIRDGQVVRLRDETRIDLGGIAKGYAVGEAVRVLKACGVRSALVDAGGDIYAYGRIEGRPWRVGIRRPRGEGILGVMELDDQSTAISGDYERYFEQDGVRYHHILDPATGYPARGVQMALVVSSNATLADAWTKIFVLGPEKGLRCIEGVPGVSAMLVATNGECHYSPGLQARIRPPAGR
jgi:thiamine biosynthesis lipoprotein